jgi:hypothetical protein
MQKRVKKCCGCGSRLEIRIQAGISCPPQKGKNSEFSLLKSPLRPHSGSAYHSYAAPAMVIPARALRNKGGDKKSVSDPDWKSRSRQAKVNPKKGGKN